MNVCNKFFTIMVLILYNTVNDWRLSFIEVYSNQDLVQSLSSTVTFVNWCQSVQDLCIYTAVNMLVIANSVN